MGLGLQGVLADASGQPLLSTVTFRLQVLDSTESCVLFEEYHTNQNLAASTGVFSLNLGAGTGRVNKVDSSTELKSNIFRNDVTPLTLTDCANPLVMASGHNRKVRITFDAGAGPVTLSPNVTIQSSAYASVAETLQGKAPSDLAILKDDATTDLTQANLESVFSATNFPALMGLIAGTSTSYERAGRLNGGTIPTVGIGESLRWNGTGWDSFVAGGGTIGVASVTAGAGLLGGTITSNGTLSVNTGTSAGQLVQLDGSSKIPSALLPSLSTAMITSGTLGVSHGGTGLGNVSPYSILIGNMTGTAYDATTCSTQGMYLEWQTGAGFVCVPFSASKVTTGTLGMAFGGLGLNATTAGTGQLLIGNGNNTGFTLAQLTAGTGIQITNGAGSIAISLNGSGAAGPTGPTGDSVWAISGATINYTGGSVGIGTSSPVYKFQVSSGDIGLDVGSYINFNGTSGHTAIRRDGGLSGMTFRTASANRMIIDDNGNVGIGTVTPGSGLDVVTNSATNFPARFTNNWNNNSYYPNIQLFRFKSSAVQPTAEFGTGIDTHLEGTADGSVVLASQIQTKWETDPTAGSARNTYISFVNRTADVPSEKMRISASGNVGIGTTAPSGKVHIEGGEIIAGPLSAATGDGGRLSLRELAAGGTNSVSLRAPDAIAANYSLTLPAATGASGQVLGTDASGALSWVTSVGSAGWIQGGNSFSQSGTLGTNDTQDLVLETNNSPRVTITSSGSVGIGTTTPTSLFDVTGGIIHTNNTSGSNALGLQLNNSSTSTGAANGIRFRNSTITMGELEVGVGASTAEGYLAFTTRSANANSERMRIHTNGNVGIGTAAPLDALHVARSGNSYARFSDGVGSVQIGVNGGGDGAFWNPNSGRILIFGTNNLERARLDGNGNFGIGTTNTAAVLHLAGNRSASAWTTSGIGIRQDAATYTDTSSSGTVGNIAVNALAQPTLSASSATTYTRASTLYIPSQPTAGANVGITNAFALDVNAPSRLSGKVIFGGGQSLSVATSLVNISAGGGVMSTPSWTTTGVMSATLPATVTDTTGTGTIATRASNSFGQPTFASSNAVTLTNASTIYIDNAPAAGTNTTITNPLALHVAAGNSSFGGSVGIGTSSPATTLHVVGGTRLQGGASVYDGSALTFSDAGLDRSTSLVQANDADFRITSTNGNISLMPAGSVGIGTTNPTSKLEVAGDAKVTGNVLMGWERVAGTSVLVPAGTQRAATATCTAGKKIIGGGCQSNWYATYINENYASSDTVWTCSAYNSSGNDSTLYPHVICARVGD